MPRKVTPFNKGWHDKINGLLPDEPRGQDDAMAYERGRHAAVLYLHWHHVHGTIKLPAQTYASARGDMPIELRQIIDKERVFCSWRPKKARPVTYQFGDGRVHVLPEDVMRGKEAHPVWADEYAKLDASVWSAISGKATKKDE